MNKINHEQLENFVHSWFADLDQLKAPEVFLERLDKNFEFNIYGSKLFGHKGFLSIYSGMQVKSDFTAHHIASNIVSKQVSGELFQINFDIALEQHIANNVVSRSESLEEWLVKKENEKLIIMTYAII
ncbi:hypothetical protein [Marinifilum caeruleilacunae]|uniref:Nuclear transport factor 2 family protein n=1 Tax=Marinifilum caeruleilacunae TaxID=2499076 RepID=A0ABX1WQI3_9BACT|nr:hypothetical protein [Marinifilum caeruleilacunae]NOU58296.1 hypothetical protein [Marinifilum caeruleilacunae]